MHRFDRSINLDDRDRAQLDSILPYYSAFAFRRARQASSSKVCLCRGVSPRAASTDAWYRGRFYYVTYYIKIYLLHVVSSCMKCNKIYYILFSEYVSIISYLTYLNLVTYCRMYYRSHSSRARQIRLIL